LRIDGNEIMDKPILFISHSTSGLDHQNRSVQLRDSLYATLSENWYVPIDIYNIEPGDEWRIEILHMLAEARAGIILFNDKAISQSKWVTAEALILCFRKSIDPSFQIIPVLLDGKKISDTCFSQYEPFQLKEIQCINDDTSLSPEKSAENIAKHLDPEKARQPPMSPWVRRVVQLLDRDQVKINYLQEAAEKLKLDHKYAQNIKPKIDMRGCLCRAVVDLMHHNNPIDSLGAINLLLRMLTIEGADEFRDCLTAKWVENNAMETILNASHKPEETGILTINTSRQDVIDEYLRRAEIEIPEDDCTKWFVPVSDAAGEGDDAMMKQVETAIRAEIVPYPITGDDGVKLSTPQAVERQLSRQGDVAICVLPEGFAKPGLIRKLRNEYKKIIFLIRVGDPEEKLSLFDSLGGKALRPALDVKKYNELSFLKNRLMPKKR
jgi:hypothetical protein